jgi:hypothetical protein
MVLLLQQLATLSNSETEIIWALTLPQLERTGAAGTKRVGIPENFKCHTFDKSQTVTV